MEIVTSMANGFMVFKFKTEEGLLKIIDKGHGCLEGSTLSCTNDTLILCLTKKITKITVWIWLHGLPFPLWSRKVLSMAASMMCRPLSYDELTFNCPHIEYARLCVELDASTPLVHQFDIESPLSDELVKVEVEYEWKPKICSKCKAFGHNFVAATKTINRGGHYGW